MNTRIKKGKLFFPSLKLGPIQLGKKGGKLVVADGRLLCEECFVVLGLLLHIIITPLGRIARGGCITAPRRSCGDGSNGRLLIPDGVAAAAWLSVVAALLVCVEGKGRRRSVSHGGKGRLGAGKAAAR